MIFWNINISKFTRDYLGRKFFRAKHYNWLMSLLSPIQTNVDEYALWRKERFYLINITGQTISLTGYLNDKFDSTQRLIYIVTSNVVYSGVWVALEQEVDFFLAVGLEAENQGVFIGMESEQNSGDDFIVYLPSNLYNDADKIPQIKSAIYQLKLAGKTFHLEPI